MAKLPEKKCWTSKTLLFNILGGVVVLLQYLGTIKAIEPELLSTVLVAVNFCLRFISNDKIDRSLT